MLPGDRSVPGGEGEDADLRIHLYRVQKELFSEDERFRTGLEARHLPEVQKQKGGPEVLLHQHPHLEKELIRAGGRTDFRQVR